MSKFVNKIISINKRRTSMRLSAIEWDAINQICKIENISRNKLIESVEDCKDEDIGLSYSTRLFALQYYRSNAKLHKKSGDAVQNISKIMKTIMK